METTTMGLGFRVILGIYWDNGKYNGNYYSILGVILRLRITPSNIPSTPMITVL